MEYSRQCNLAIHEMRKLIECSKNSRDRCLIDELLQQKSNFGNHGMQQCAQSSGWHLQHAGEGCNQPKFITFFLIHNKRCVIWTPSPRPFSLFYFYFFLFRSALPLNAGLKYEEDVTPPFYQSNEREAIAMTTATFHSIPFIPSVKGPLKKKYIE